MKTLLPSLRITNARAFGEEKSGAWLLIECEDTAGRRADHLCVDGGGQTQPGREARHGNGISMAVGRLPR